MDRDRMQDLLSEWLVAREADRFRAATGILDPGAPDPRDLAVLRERAADLAGSPVREAFAVAAAPDSPRDARWLELLGDAVADLAAVEGREQVERLRAERVFDAPAGPVSFHGLEAWLTRQRGVAEVAPYAGRIEAAAERIGDAERERAALLLAAAADHGAPPLEESRAAARGRSGEIERAWAREVVEATLPRLPGARGSATEGLPSWLALPLRLRFDAASRGLPAPDVGLARFLCERLGVDRLFDRRVRLDLGDRPGRSTRELVAFMPGTGRVVAAGRPLGRLADYGAVLRLLGRALSRAGLEGDAGIAAFRADPALEFMHGALLEGQLVRPAWLERALGGVPPASVLQGWWMQSVARTARLAAEVSASDGGTFPVHPASPAMATRGRAEELVVLCPGGPLPWSGPVGEAADELAGRLVAVAVDDLLSRRWGSAWSLAPGAGALLRDLWAAGHATLAALCSDLGLDAPSPGAALDLLGSGPP